LDYLLNKLEKSGEKGTL